MREASAIALGLLCGVVLAIYDTRTDDTAIELGLLLLTSGGLALLAPKWWWLVALLVGGFIPLVELGPLDHIPAGIVALGVTFAGALIGFAISRASKTAVA